jgi:ferrous iron transport protein B
MANDLRIENKMRDRIVAALYQEADEIMKRTVTVSATNRQSKWETGLDNILTGPVTGYLIMLFLLGAAFWLTISGANYPSEMLANLFSALEEKLLGILAAIGAPEWFIGLFVLGLFRTLGWVVSVMLPPMAIFFPLFTLMEDLGYLPRVAFNLDYLFKKCGTHGKQALTMCMGFGCNAAGVTACRIIDSPRERLIATLTNNFVPCNGRFPTLILMASLFLAGSWGSFGVTLAVMAVVLTGIATTLAVSWLLSRTLLKGMASTFTLELPPFRKPQIGQVVIRSILDRTVFVLGRAVAVAAPAGLLIWVLANVQVEGVPLLNLIAGTLDPLARAIGLDGIILMAFILGLPANEIVVPLIFMGYLATGSLIELTGLQEIRQLLVEAQGWTWLTAVNVMLFSLLHFPCGTTLLTVYKETKSRKWTFLSFLLPTGIGIVLCFLLTQIVRFFGLV